MRATRIIYFAFAALLMLCFCACSDDEDEVNTAQIVGKWEKVYDKDVVSEGGVQLTFTASSATDGNCEVYVYDVFAGDSTYSLAYTIDRDQRRLTLFNSVYGQPTDPIYYEIKKLTSKWMTLHLINSDVILNYKKVG